jgi:hypothetical protein
MDVVYIIELHLRLYQILLFNSKILVLLGNTCTHLYIGCSIHLTRTSGTLRAPYNDLKTKPFVLAR